MSERHLISDIKALKLSSAHDYDYMKWFPIGSIFSVDEQNMDTKLIVQIEKMT